MPRRRPQEQAAAQRAASRKHASARRVARQGQPPRATSRDVPFRQVNGPTWTGLFEQVMASPDNLDEALNPAASTNTDWREEHTLRTPSKVADETVLDCISFIDRTALVPFFTGAMEKAKRKSGRPARFTPLAILVGLWWCVTENRAPHLAEIATFLTRRLSPEMEQLLGVRSETLHVPVAIRHNASAAALTGGQSHTYTDLKAAERALGSLFKNMLALCDPSVLPKNRRMTHADLLAARRDVPDKNRIVLQAMLDWVCNQLLHTTFMAIPRQVRRRWLRHPSGCIDATPMRLPARLENGRWASSDPDGGPYKRYSEMNPDVIKKFVQALDVHLFISGDDDPGNHQHIPGLAMSMTTDRPGVDPAGAARRLFASLAYRRLTPNHLNRPGFLGGDRLYPGQDANYIQIPAAEVGYGLVMDYRDDQLGYQGGHTSGMALVEGHFHCPAMTGDLVNATADYPAGRITTEQYHDAIAKRNDYRMRVKSASNQNGTLRLRCPAAGDAPTAACVLKPRSLQERAIRQPDGRITDARFESHQPAKHSAIARPTSAPASPSHSKSTKVRNIGRPQPSAPKNTVPCSLPCAQPKKATTASRKTTPRKHSAAPAGAAFATKPPSPSSPPSCPQPPTCARSRPSCSRPLRTPTPNSST